MNYDISTREKSIETLKMMVKDFEWQELYDTYNEYSDLGKAKDEIMKKVQDNIFVDFEDLYFVISHITTSANQCKDIKENGLHDLQWVLENNTELRGFLKKYGIVINAKDNCILIDKEEEEKVLKLDEYENIYRKINNDPSICGFFGVNNNVFNTHYDKRPEILYDIAKCLKKCDIERDWQSSYIPYEVKFKVKYLDVEIALEEVIKEVSLDTMKKQLLSCALNVFLEDIKGYVAVLKKDVCIPPQNILSISEFSK